MVAISIANSRPARAKYELLLKKIDMVAHAVISAFGRLRQKD